MGYLVNISDEPLEVRVATVPGERPTITRLDPGEIGEFADGYCVPYLGAGRKMLAPVLTQQYSRDGVALLVPRSDVQVARKRFEESLTKQGRKPKAWPPEGVEMSDDPTMPQAPKAKVKPKMRIGGPVEAEG